MEGDQNLHKGKKSKQRRENNSQRCEDLISKMPDEMIQHILSFMLTEESVRTTALSKRWVTIWEGVPTLSLKHLYVFGEQQRGFPIDKTLIRFRASSVSWKLLKEFSFSSTHGKNEIVGSIISKCPLLECVRLENCNPVKRIASTKLLKLELDGCCFLDGGNHTMEIYTPNLRYFTLSGRMMNTKCVLMDVPSSLRKATLNFHMLEINDHEDYVKGLMKQLCHAPKINLGMWCVKVMSIMELKGLDLPLLKCKTLNLDVRLFRCILPAILNLLKSVPHLYELGIDVIESSQDDAEIEDELVFGPFNLSKGENWISRMKRISYPLHLKFIEDIIALYPTLQELVFQN